MRKISLADIDDIALGATLLGAGGGGDPYIAKLMVKQYIAEYGEVDLIDVTELDDDDVVVCSAIYGAPTVIVEKLPAGPEFIEAVLSLEKYLGKKIKAVLPVEVGGMNTLTPFIAAAKLRIPCVNADGMRRAFPQLDMTTFTLHDISATPACLTDEKGNKVIFETVTNKTGEILVRNTSVVLGLGNGASFYSMTAAQLKKAGVLDSISYCLEIGKLLRKIQNKVDHAWQDFYTFTQGKEFFRGKIIDLDRRTTDGFSKGIVTVESFINKSDILSIDIQNELLLATLNNQVVVTPPDLICLLDHDTGIPITTETLAYGQRVVAIALPAAPEWNHPKTLDVVGPRAFGYDVDYVEFGGKI